MTFDELKTSNPEAAADLASYDTYLRGVLSSLFHVFRDAQPERWGAFAAASVDPVLATLEEWVRGGGRLVVTGPSGTREGTSGMFKRRESPLLAGLLGSAGNGGGSQPLTVKHGGGTVVSTTASPGMDYYLKENERPSRLGQIAEMIGPSEHLDAPSLPSTVGAFCWKSPDSRTLFVDLVNYNIDPDADRITAAENIGFRIRVAQGTKEVAVKPLSPDDDARATATLVDGWATVQVPALRHFISVKLITGQ